MKTSQSRSLQHEKHGRQSQAGQRGRNQAPSSVDSPQRLASAMGNRAFGHMLQAKLAVSAPSDQYEREADRVADRVMRMASPAKPAPMRTPRGIQRQCTACASGAPCPDCKAKADIDPRPLEPDITPMVQRSAAGPGDGPTTAMSAGAHTSAATVDDAVATPRSAGRPLTRDLRAFFEPRFGTDFGAVRIHNGPWAESATRSLSARAYTLGNHLVFGKGEYKPGTDAGRRLLAHELTHVVQQGKATGSVRRMIQRRWDQPTTECNAEPTGKHIERIVIDQETPQSVTLHWSDASQESFQCSTGKGHCCVDPTEPDVVGCSVPESRRNGSNCTPIMGAPGYLVLNRYLSRNGWLFWTDIVPSRGIGMHQYPVHDGTPLSHGCVRMAEASAKRIFCGVRRNRTRVEITNFARPLCNHPQLIAEWQDDLTFAATPTDGEPPDVRRGILETRRTLREAFRVDDAGLAPILATPPANVAAAIPRCSYLTPDAESSRLTPRPGQSRSPGERLSAGAGFAGRATRLTASLGQARTLTQAQSRVRLHAQQLWNAATRRARGGNTDDRPIYWARLQMIEAIRQVRFRFLTTPAERRALIETFDRVSRGMSSVTFPAQSSDKKILISGFDPFDLQASAGGDRRHGNPSGAAALALDGARLRNGSVRARVQSVIFPVRFRAFNQGLVETVFRPFLTGPDAVDMIMTISQGTSADFEVEQFAGRRRSSGSFADNLGQVGGGTTNAPVEPPGLAAGPEFMETELPHGAIRASLGRTTPLRSETEVDEITAGGTTAVNRSNGPTGGTTGFAGRAVEGSGGGFLSNEIFYRTLLLRRSEGSTIPVGHLHTPFLGLPSGSRLSDRAFTRARTQMVRTIRSILEATLPTL